MSPEHYQKLAKTAKRIQRIDADLQTLEALAERCASGDLPAPRIDLSWKKKGEQAPSAFTYNPFLITFGGTPQQKNREKIKFALSEESALHLMGALYNTLHEERARLIQKLPALP